MAVVYREAKYLSTSLCRLRIFADGADASLRFECPVVLVKRDSILISEPVAKEPLWFLMVDLLPSNPPLPENLIAVFLVVPLTLSLPLLMVATSPFGCLSVAHFLSPQSGCRRISFMGHTPQANEIPKTGHPIVHRIEKRREAGAFGPRPPKWSVYAGQTGDLFASFTMPRMTSMHGLEALMLRSLGGSMSGGNPGADFGFTPYFLMASCIQTLAATVAAA